MSKIQELFDEREELKKDILRYGNMTIELNIGRRPEYKYENLGFFTHQHSSRLNGFETKLFRKFVQDLKSKAEFRVREITKQIDSVDL